MSVDNDIRVDDRERTPAAIVVAPRGHRPHLPRRLTRRRPRVRKLRLLLILAGFGVLAIISTLFGALTSVAAYLPQLQNTAQFSSTVDSYMYDINGTPIGPLAPASHPALDNWYQISPYMRNAIISVEDRGFWQESGISVRGLLRAAVNDLTGGATQGGSTIPEEFIKNVRQEEAHRTIGEKVIEAAMAFQLSHHWTHAHILAEYLNTIYFGNGALGIEAAARVYFGWKYGYNSTNPTHQSGRGCGDPNPQNPHRRSCASMLNPADSALLAGLVANPSAFNPAGDAAERAAAKGRRNLVLKDMYQQHYITAAQYQKYVNSPLPPVNDIRMPAQQPTAAPYFTSWVEPQVVNALEHEGLTPKQAQYEADYGGLKIKLSIDLSMQNWAQQAVANILPQGQGLPSASLVAIDNNTGEVRAMVSGYKDYAQSPFNLATMGLRQPGSAFKLFTLAAALSSGQYNADSLFTSKPITIRFVHQGGNAFAAANGTGRFKVINFANEYLGSIPLWEATAVSDNSVFSQLGMSIGTAKIKHYAQLLGIRSPISTNPSMILGGLSTGVSALDMAHAYSSVANGGVKIFNPILGDIYQGPVGIDAIMNCRPCRQHDITNRATMQTDRVLTPTVASTITSLLHGPVQDSYGTGQAAAIPGVSVSGKTGTTNNYVDAWFVGYTPELTVAVWVGYPNSGKPMTTQFKGGPVEGGTYPAIIWRTFQEGALQILSNEAAHKSAHANTVTGQLITNTYTQPTSTASTATSTATSTTTTPSTTATTTTPVVATTPTPQTTLPAQQTPSAAGGSAPTAPATGAASPNQTLPQNTPPAAPSGSSSTGGTGGSGL